MTNRIADHDDWFIDDEERSLILAERLARQHESNEAEQRDRTDQLGAAMLGLLLAVLGGYILLRLSR